MNIEPIIGVENAVAGGFFDWIRGKKSEDTQGYTNESWNTLKKYGDYPVQQIVLARTPIGSAINTALNIITFGALDRAKKELSYDKLFHLQMVVSVKLPTGNLQQIVVEKNERINISPGFKVYKTTETYPIDLRGQELTLNEMMRKTRNIMGDWFHQYDAFASGGNCQYFVLSVLEANRLNSRGATEFLFQNVQKIAQKLPGYTKPIARALTDIASWWSKLTGAGYMEGRGRFRGGRFVENGEDEEIEYEEMEGSGLTGGELAEKIEEEIERPLTGDELLEEFPKSMGQLNVILYGDLKGREIDEVLDDHGRVVILYPGESPTNGHWVCLWKQAKDHYHFFDSYGDAPETQKRNIPKSMLREWGLEHPLLKLAVERQGGALGWNKIAFQEESSSVNTCGRFCLCRLAMKEMSDKEFEKLITESGVSPDEFVSILTMPEVWKSEDDEMEGGRLEDMEGGVLTAEDRQTLRNFANAFVDSQLHFHPDIPLPRLKLMTLDEAVKPISVENPRFHWTSAGGVLFEVMIDNEQDVADAKRIVREIINQRFEALIVEGGRLATPEEIARGDFVEVGINRTKRYQDNSQAGIQARREQYQAEAPLRERREADLRVAQQKRADEFGGFWGFGEKAWRNRERAKILGPLVRLMNDEALSEEDRLAGLVQFVDWMTEYYVAKETPATSGQYDDLWIAINNISNEGWKQKLLDFLNKMRDMDYMGEFWQRRIQEAEEERMRAYQEAMERYKRENPVMYFMNGIAHGLSSWVNDTLVKPLTNVANLVLSNIPGIGQIYTKLGIGNFLTKAGEDFTKSVESLGLISDPTVSAVTQVGSELVSSAIAPVSKGLQAVQTASDVADIVQGKGLGQSRTSSAVISDDDEKALIKAHNELKQIYQSRTGLLRQLERTGETPELNRLITASQRAFMSVIGRVDRIIDRNRDREDEIGDMFSRIINRLKEQNERFDRILRPTTTEPEDATADATGVSTRTLSSETDNDDEPDQSETARWRYRRDEGRRLP